MFELLKDMNHKRTLRKLSMEPRKKRIENLEAVKTIGIVFNVGSETEWRVMENFITKMEVGGKKVNIIGLQPSKQTIDYLITPTNAVICRAKEDTNLWGKPKEELIASFVDKKYDVLIDMTRQPNYFGQYISMRTKADLKIAQIDTTAEGSEQVTPQYDMMIASAGAMEAKEYLSNVENYLLMIKK